MIKSFLQYIAVVCLMALGAASAWADGSVMFNYQGRVKVQGSPYNGTGQFKFAILNTSASASLWSNDGTSSAGSEPTASLPLTVTDGIFDVVMGDTALMAGIDPTIFQSRTPLRLRVWFNDGSHGFQALNPDHKLINVSLISSETGGGTCMLYVNGTTGNDGNSGLTPATAKKTIQAAVDILPGKIRCDFTIDIADGVYREEVQLAGITVLPNKTLTLLGDDSWTTTSVGDPAVRITGSDSDATSGTRLTALNAVDCNNVVLKGIYFHNTARFGVEMQKGTYKLVQCKSAYNNGWGFFAYSGTTATYYDCTASNNTNYGFDAVTQSSGQYYRCKGIDNGIGGASANGHSIAHFHETGVYDNNGYVGVRANGFCDTAFIPPFVGTINGNAQYGVHAGYNSFFAKNGQGTISGNPSGVHVLGFASAFYP